jgi:hypothetical protein
MEPNDLLRAIETALRPQIKGQQGDLRVCEDELAALELLMGGPNQGWLCLMLMTEGKPAARLGGTNDHEQLTFTFFVSRPRGLTVDPSKGLHKETAAGLPLLRRISQVRREVQRLRFVEPSTGGDPVLTSDQVDPLGLVFSGWKLLGIEDAPENHFAARLNFTLHVAFTAPELERVMVPVPVS